MTESGPLRERLALELNDIIDEAITVVYPRRGADIRHAVTAIEALIGSEVAQAGERRDLLVDRDTDTAKHPFVPSALNASFCMRCGETATWHPHNIRPPSRVCRGCGHQWPHGGVFVFAGNEGREEWAGNFCEVCDDPCTVDKPIVLDDEYARGYFEGVVSAQSREEKR